MKTNMLRNILNVIACILLTPPSLALAQAPDRSPVGHPLDRPLVTVHKTPWCGCCSQWIEHMREHGFEVSVIEAGDLGPVKERVGVPAGKGSCHTAEVEGYFLEGHVPAEDVHRLLAERPAARGLTVPGMPAGSPGMEQPDGYVQPYSVELIGEDGSAREWARHGGESAN
ncbi:MAG TPA: DUF411 domain-containing protein [Pseudomonas sp.]|nr:DUF411 domain-containing protein [Pseudomonas sp.]